MQPSLEWYSASRDELAETGFRTLPRAKSAMHPLDEAIFLFHVAAEVEHALLVQYLYAAYSLDEFSEDPAQQELLDKWVMAIVEVARQEMGHLATVQNLLLVLGGPLNFEREDFPFRSELYPFHFRLERLSRNSLAKYVVAEMPPLHTLPPADRRVVRRAMRQAAAANRRLSVNRVGALYARLKILVRSLDPSVFRFDTLPRWQALPEDFHWNDGSDLSQPFICSIGTIDAAVRAIELVAIQGEGSPTPEVVSHFHTFYGIYTDPSFPAAGSSTPQLGWIPTRAVPTDPQLSHRGDSGTPKINCITDEVSCGVAQLANLRYANCLILLNLYFRTDRRSAVDIKSQLAQWIREEMRDALGALGLLLPTLPRHAPLTTIMGEPAVSAVPFHLPYTMQSAFRSSDTWRSAWTLAQQAGTTIGKLMVHPSLNEQTRQILERIQEIDRDREPLIRQMSEPSDLHS